MVQFIANCQDLCLSTWSHENRIGCHSLYAANVFALPSPQFSEQKHIDSMKAQKKNVIDVDPCTIFFPFNVVECRGVFT